MHQGREKDGEVRFAFFRGNTLLMLSCTKRRGWQQSEKPSACGEQREDKIPIVVILATSPCSSSSPSSCSSIILSCKFAIKAARPVTRVPALRSDTNAGSRGRPLNLLMLVPSPLAGSWEKLMEPYQVSWIYGKFLSIGCWRFWFFFVAPTSVRVCGCIVAGGLHVAPKRMLSQVISA